jgi:hypothetical protein
MRVAGLIGPGAPLADANAETADNQSIVTVVAQDAADNYSDPVFATVASDGASATVTFTASDDMPAMIDGWTGGVYTHTSEDGMTVHTVTKYNDKAADKGVAYSMFFSDTNIAATHRAADAVASQANGVLTLDADVTGHHGLFGGNMAAAPLSGNTVGYTGATEVSGTFRGVSGTFECASGCSKTHDSDGNLTGVAGTWTFVPTVIDGLDATDTSDGGGLAMITKALGELMVPGVMQDPDYMILGYWEQSVTADGDTAETMLPFADGKRDYGAVTAVTGSARYTGPATGLYMRKTLTSQSVVDQEGTFSSGQFTANAILMANFGGTSVAQDDQFSITGTISDFKNMNGEDIDGDWVVNLNRRMIDQDSDAATPDQAQRNIGAALDAVHGTGATGTFLGVTHGGELDDPSNMGSWSGTFHGASSADQPTSASGTFDAHFTNGHVRGAFATNAAE